MTALPRSVQLPSGRVVELAAKAGLAARRAKDGAPLFAEAIELFESGDAQLRERGAPVAVGSLELRDFHALRAIATAAGLLAEDTLDLSCRNCGAPIAHAPCAALPLGPFVDRELDDPDLDATLDLGEPHEIPAVRLGRGRDARDVRLSPLTVDDALPLFRALARPPLALTGAIVRAMGISALGTEANPARIARALSDASDDAWHAVTDLFLLAHYPPRLFSIAICSTCKARNDVDAPYEREFDPAPRGADVPPAKGAPRAFEPLPGFDAFAERARAISSEAFAAEGLDDVAFVVEGGVPAVDDGGEPLMGAYVPGSPGDMASPSRAPEITVYYRTFRAIWDEDGPFDWDDELRETIEHELEHHLAFLAGDDPMDDEEREEIRGEALRVLGKRAIVREGVRTMGADAWDFIRKTWPIWLILAAATIIATLRG